MKFETLVASLMFGGAAVCFSAERETEWQPGSLAGMIQELGDTATSMDVIYGLILDAEAKIAENENDTAIRQSAQYDLDLFLVEFQSKMTYYSNLLERQSKDLENFHGLFTGVSNWLPVLDAREQVRSVLCTNKLVAISLRDGSMVSNEVAASNDEQAQSIVRIDRENGVLESNADVEDGGTGIGLAQLEGGFGRFIESHPLHDRGYRLKTSEPLQYDLNRKLQIVQTDETDGELLIYCASADSKWLLLIDDTRIENAAMIRWRKLDSE